MKEVSTLSKHGVGTSDLNDEVFALTKKELSWVFQEVDREVSSLDLLLGGLTNEERKRIRKNVIDRCMITLRKGRERC